MLHSQKSLAILEWYNSLTTKANVNSLTQFADGSYFCEIIASFPPISPQSNTEGNVSTESVVFSETSIACNEEVVTYVEEGAAEEKMEVSASEVVDDNPFVIKEYDNTDILKKYDIVRKFIDGFYKMDSSSFFNYEECQNGNEMELAKVTIFILSAMVQNLLALGEAVVYNTTLLDSTIQENIHECLAIVIEEKDEEVKKSELHKVLSRPANAKVTPARKQPPRNIADQKELPESAKNVPKNRKEKVSNELVPNSPLKNLLDSPKILYKAALFKKNAELIKLRKDLDEEENKVTNLMLEKKNMNDELEEKNRKLAFYKLQLQSLREEAEEKEKMKIEELNIKKLAEERFRKRIESQEEEIKRLKENNDVLNNKVADLEKKLELDATTSVVSKNENWKKKVFELEHEIVQKDIVIDTLKSKVASLEIDLKGYKECYSTNRRNTKESSTKIIYADEQSPREPFEKKELDSESKEEGIKRLGINLQQYMIGEGLKNKNPNVETLRVDVFKKENKTLAAKLKFYESKYGQEDWNSVKTEIDCVSEASSSYSAKYDNKMENQSLDCYSDEALVAYEKTSLKGILKEFERNNWFTPSKVTYLRSICSKIQDQGAVSAFLTLLIGAMRESKAFIATQRSRSLRTDDDIIALTDKNKNLEQEVQTLKQNLKSIQGKLIKKEEEASEKCERLQISNDGLMKEVENLKKENSIIQEKYNTLEKIIKKKEKDLKTVLTMYRTFEKIIPKKVVCEECEKLRMKLKELNSECLDYEQETAELQASIKNLQGQIKNFQCQVKELSKEKKKLELQLWQETSVLSGRTSERDALILHYFKKGADEAAKRAKDPELKKNEALNNSSQPVVNFNTYILKRENETSASNSFLASRGIPSGCFQADNEDDYLNHSSLAEIHNEDKPDDRLQELYRRNTLCQPHLQSIYPVELQNMTPNEKKYKPDGSSFGKGKKQIDKKQGNVSDDSNVSRSFQVKKRKDVEMDNTSMHVSKKQCKPSAAVARTKPSTPLKRVAAFVRRQSTFKTPRSVHRLMSMPRHRKAE